MKKSYAVAPGVIAETLGEEVIVMSPESQLSVHLSGQAATVFSAVQAGAHVPDHSQDVLDALVEQGVVSSVSSHTVTRRGLITGVATGVGVGMVSLSLPGVAFASSGVPVTGGWFYVTESFGDPETEFYVEAGIYLVAFGIDFDDSLGNGVFLDGVLQDMNGDPFDGPVPSSLTIAGLATPIPVETWVSTEGSLEDIDQVDPDSPPAYDYVTWHLPATEFPDGGVAASNLSDPITARFTWNGVSYVATLPQIHPAP